MPRVLQGPPPSALGLGSPPPSLLLLCWARMDQQHLPSTLHPLQHPALPQPPPHCPPCCSPGCQSSIFGPLPLQFMARSGGTAPPCTPPFLAQLLARPGEGCRVLVLCAPKPQPGTAGRGGPRGNNWWGGLVEVPGVGDHRRGPGGAQWPPHSVARAGRWRGRESEQPMTPATFLPLNWELEWCKCWDQSQEGVAQLGRANEGCRGWGGPSRAVTQRRDRRSSARSRWVPSRRQPRSQHPQAETEPPALGAGWGAAASTAVVPPPMLCWCPGAAPWLSPGLGEPQGHGFWDPRPQPHGIAGAERVQLQQHPFSLKN